MKKLTAVFGFVCFATLVTLFSSPSFARRGGGGGGHLLGGGLIFMSPTQTDLNSFIDDQTVVGSKNLATAYELFMDYEYRFSGSMFAINFRPAYFTQSASGSGIEASLSGLTFFPIFRIYALESDFIRFFFQIGLGYGHITAKLANAGGSGTYTGGTFGALGGIGAAFCITSNSCFAIEGNMRYLPIMPVTGSGNLALTGVSQVNGELERNNSDLQVTMGGIQGILSYQYRF